MVSRAVESLIKEFLRINRTEGRVRNILIYTLAEGLSRLAHSVDQTIEERLCACPKRTLVVCGNYSPEVQGLFVARAR